MSGNTGFKYFDNLVGRNTGILVKKIIANSEVISVGEMIKGSSGFLVTAGAASPILGVVVGIVDKNGINMDNSKLTLAGTSAAWASSTQTFTAGSNNTTTDQVSALVDIDPMSRWSAATDNASTDTQASLFGCYTDITATSDQADDDTGATTQAQLFIWGVDPENSGRNIYSIAEHQIWQAT